MDTGRLRIEFGTWWLFWNWSALPGGQGHEGEASSGCCPPSPHRTCTDVYILSWVLMIFAAWCKIINFMDFCWMISFWFHWFFFSCCCLALFLTPPCTEDCIPKMREESSSSLLSFLLLSSCDDCLLLSAWHTPEEVEELPRSNWPVVGLSVGNCLDHWLLSEGPALCGWKHPWEGWIRKPGDGEPECEIVSYVPTHVRFSSCLNFCPDFPWWPTYDPWDELFPFLTHVGKVLAFLVLVFIKIKDALSFLHAFCVGGRLISLSSPVCFSVLWRPWLSFISNYSPYISCPFFLH